MELTVMKCPNCAGEIQYTPGNTQTRCPYCDSIVHISMTADEARFEQDAAELAAAKEKYFKQLAKFKKIKYVCMVLAFLSGIPFAAVNNESALFILAGLPALFFTFAGSPVVHSFAPEPPEGIKNNLAKNEKPTSKGKLYAIFIGLMFLGFVIVPSHNSDSSTDDSSASSSVVTEAEAGND